VQSNVQTKPTTCSTYCSSKIRGIIWLVACGAFGGRRERHTVFRWENLKKGGHFEDTGLDRRIIIKWILKDRMRWNSLNSSGSGYEPSN